MRTRNQEQMERMCTRKFASGSPAVPARPSRANNSTGNSNQRPAIMRASFYPVPPMRPVKKEGRAVAVKKVGETVAIERTMVLKASASFYPVPPMRPVKKEKRGVAGKKEGKTGAMKKTTGPKATASFHPVPVKEEEGAVTVKIEEETEEINQTTVQKATGAADHLHTVLELFHDVDVLSSEMFI
ncbi:hypothetical protein LSTR_LSTR000542 [Laodelphax striatellus]|uniref:Uncharacterized protein n=1 Tax=Laodelphax striatellus TaxID=195883 RepID=A0A482XH81_LAOST|nr:hypothetical protein LSTR_LSTR000542 [Laodelphax striatellus]